MKKPVQPKILQAVHNHSNIIAKLQSVKKLRVCFLVCGLGSWKCQSVYNEMCLDPRFEPLIALQPVVTKKLASSRARYAQDLRDYFDKQSVPYLDLTEVGPQVAARKLKTLGVDLYVFTNPFSLTYHKIDREILFNELTCYIPYHHEVVEYADNQTQYNQVTHNGFWRIYVSHEHSKNTFEEFRDRGSEGVVVSGLPCCEDLLVESNTRSPWKPQTEAKKKIVYAPHWLLDENIKWATIYEFAQSINQIAKKYRDQVQWAMRPHPFLRAGLEMHPNWNAEKANAFFDFWENEPYLQIEEGDYVPLFQQSDAMIHDSGSFLAEYLYVNKPVMYLRNQETLGHEHLNEFGKSARAVCSIGTNPDEIEAFVLQVIQGIDEKRDVRSAFRDSQLMPYFEASPAKRICNDIFDSIKM